MAERNLPPDESTPSPDVDGVPLSAKGAEAMARAEQKAVAAREKHAKSDAELAARAQLGPSNMSSGIRVAPPKSRRNQAAGSVQVPTPSGAVAVTLGAENAKDVLAPASTLGQESRVQAATAAFTLMEEIQEEKAERDRATRRDVMWYVRCHKCGGPGIWVYKDRNNLNADGWAASYKPVGVMWPSKDVWCQCCLHYKQREVPLKILHISDAGGRVRSIRPYPRMLVEISIEEYNRLMGQSAEQEPETADAV